MQRDRDREPGGEHDRQDRRREGAGPLVEVDHRRAWRKPGEHALQPSGREPVPDAAARRLRGRLVPDVGKPEADVLDARMAERGRAALPDRMHIGDRDAGFGKRARRVERDALRAAAGIGKIGDDHDPHARPGLHRTRLHEPR